MGRPIMGFTGSQGLEARATRHGWCTASVAFAVSA